MLIVEDVLVLRDMNIFSMTLSIVTGAKRRVNLIFTLKSNASKLGRSLDQMRGTEYLYYQRLENDGDLASLDERDANLITPECQMSVGRKWHCTWR